MANRKRLEQMKRLAEAGGVPLPKGLGDSLLNYITTGHLEELISWTLRVGDVHRESGAQSVGSAEPPPWDGGGLSP